MSQSPIRGVRTRRRRRTRWTRLRAEGRRRGYLYLVPAVLLALLAAHALATVLRRRPVLPTAEALRPAEKVKGPKGVTCFRQAGSPAACPER